MTSQTLCDYLNSNCADLPKLSGKTKQTILEFILKDPTVTDYGDLAIFPFEDGVYRSISNGVAFVHRDNSEMALFNKQRGRNPDLEQLSEPTMRALNTGYANSTLHPSIRYQSVKSLKEYCMSIVFKGLPENQDSNVLDDDGTLFVSQAWTWISQQSIEILDEDISSLWLLPLSNGSHRKVQPRSPQSVIFVAPAGKAGNLMRSLDAKAPVTSLPLLLTSPKALGCQSSSIVADIRNSKSNMVVKDARDFLISPMAPQDSSAR